MSGDASWDAYVNYSLELREQNETAYRNNQCTQANRQRGINWLRRPEIE